jgi:streptogramin lyase
MRAKGVGCLQIFIVYPIVVKGGRQVSQLISADTATKTSLRSDLVNLQGTPYYDRSLIVCIRPEGWFVALRTWAGLGAQVAFEHGRAQGAGGLLLKTSIFDVSSSLSCLLPARAMPVRNSLFCCIAVIYQLATSAPLDSRQIDSKGFEYFTLQTPESGPCDLTTGPDGLIYADTFLANKIVQINPQTSTLVEYSIPYRLPVLNDSVLPSDAQGRVALACVVQPGKDGNVYAAAGVRNELVRFNPKTSQIDVFPIGNPLGNLQPFNDAWVRLNDEIHRSMLETCS